MYRKYLCFLLTFLLVLSVSFPALAFVASPSDADLRDPEVFVDDFDNVPLATGSNALVDDFIFDNWNLKSTGDDFVASVDLTKIKARICYFDMSGVKYYLESYLDSNGYFSFVRPDNYASFGYIGFFCNKTCLPPYGNYRVQGRFSSNTGGFTYTMLRLEMSQTYKNADYKLKTFNPSFNQFSGNFEFSSTLEFNSSFNNFNVVSGIDGFRFPFGGYFKLAFNRLSSDSAVDFTPIENVDNDLQSDISDNTGTMVEQQETIIEQIINVTQTISSQLTAFWNQLAGEFTNLYNKMNTHHQEDLEAVQNQTDEITSNQDSNTDREIANEDKNTNILVGALEKLGNFIIDGLKSLFIPSDTFFKTYFDDLLSWFSDRFGFLSFPIELLVKLVDLFVNSSDVDCVLTLPSFSVSDQQLWEDMSFNLTEFLEVNFLFLLDSVRVVSSVYLIFAFMHLCEDKWNEVMEN